MHNTEIAYNIWMMCCVLHNMLLDVDGLSVGWNNVVPSQWELDAGEFDESDLPDSICRLINPNEVLRACTYDESSFGYQHKQGDMNDGDKGDQNIENEVQSSSVISEGTASK